MNIFGLLKNLWPFVKPYRLLIACTITLTFIGSLMAQVNAIVLDKAVDAINALIQNVSFDWSKATKILLIISIVLLGKELIAAFITFFQRYFGQKLRIFVSRDLSLQVIDRILTFRMSFFSAEDNDTGKLQSRIDRGVMSLSNTVNNFFIDILPLFTSAILALILMFAANFYVGLVALCIVPVYFYITYRQAKRMKGGRRSIFSSHQAVSQGILNILESISVIKSFNREQVEAEKQQAVQQTMTDRQMSTRRWSYLYDGLKSFFEQIGTVLIIILTAYLVLTDYPGMSIGKIMYHVMLFSNVSAPIRQLHRIYDDMNDALIYAEGFFGILHAHDEVEDTGEYHPDTVRGEFELNGVDFTYGNGTKALTDVSMRIQRGKITALVGLSGAGKTTIVNLLDKFYHPDSGSIKLDSTELRDWDTRWLRENIGLVLQKNHIFNGTIEENIRYGNPKATHEDVVEAARQAYIYDQIMQLPKQFDAPALQLSGGQQQRIAIARMFIKNPPIIFLDEPTASLDAVATEQIKSSIDAIKAGRTVIIISHNIGQIVDADQIYVLQKGRVVQSGTPDEVYRQGGLYKEIFDASARSMNVDKIADRVKGVERVATQSQLT
ncbi:ABC transporter ATP-binding protein [Pseudoprevotella muciniphila]|uniref:ABC transporter ATP-binding protein n=2 Tax=Pseudoprevotella muciniphila TaxID=2133944 RepID=A0A5P8E9H2_9BACT|nr:ABC transporter ATP-binding protein [Pseudoprevotella muciniphila]